MPSAAEREAAAERQAKVLQLRRAGVSFEQIGRQLGGVTPQRAQQIHKQALKRIVRESNGDTIDLEVARLDQMWIDALVVLRRQHITVSNGKVVHDPSTGRPLIDDAPVLNAIDRLLHIQERRARLLGLDAPTQAKVTVISEDAVDAEIRRLTDELASLDRVDPAGEAPAAP